MSSPKSIAFFGATGGSTAPVLARCLQAGYICTALARSADKLTTLLETTHFIPNSLIASNLTIITGDIRDPITVTQTLFPSHLNPSNPTSGHNAVSFIVSGIGCYPVMKPGYWLPHQEDPTLCEDGMNTILNALKARGPAVKPGLVALSTTGISRYGRDIPILCIPLYWLFLHEAHKDKIAMENAAIEGVKGEEAPIGSYFIIRASLLTSGAARGVENIRWGVEEGAVAANAIGYTISRADVAGFVFEKVVEPFKSGKEEGTGKVFQITY